MQWIMSSCGEKNTIVNASSGSNKRRVSHRPNLLGGGKSNNVFFSAFRVVVPL